MSPKIFGIQIHCYSVVRKLGVLMKTWQEAQLFSVSVKQTNKKKTQGEPCMAEQSRKKGNTYTNENNMMATVVAEWL